MTSTTPWSRPPRHPAARLADVPQRIRDRFLARRGEGPPDGCWFWGRRPGEYANVQWRDDDGTKRRLASHRLAWMLAHQSDIPAAMLILHGCDVPGCCNPGHLRLGTYSENQRDALDRGRWRYTPPSRPRVLTCVPAKPGTYSR